MNKGTSNTPLAALTRLKQQTVKAAAALQKEISRRESELSTLRSELGRWQALAADGKSDGKAVKTQTAGKRLDWDRILRAFSGTFTTKDIQRKTGKPMAQVYSGLARWKKERKIRGIEGGYERVAEKS